MKIVRKLGVVLSVACTLGMGYVGFDAVTQAQAAESATIAEQQRISIEVEAKRFVDSIGNKQLQCLAQNIFFEARNQSIVGQVAVAWVTLNRVDAARYPDSICGVVRQAKRDASGNVIKHRCQFSWYCDGKSDRIPNNAIAQRAWEDAQLVAEVVMLDYARGMTSPVSDATMYHANYVMPYWADSYMKVATVDSHVFYR